MNDEITNFDPTVAELNAIVEVTKSITATDLEDKAQMEVVKTNRIALKNARIKIEKKGKEMREEANAYAKRVIAKEKELIGIIEPEEDRLQAIEEEAKALAIRKERIETLPARWERLNAINEGKFLYTAGLPETIDDEYLLSLNSEEYEKLFNIQVALKNEQDKAIAEQKNLEREEEIRKEAEEKARIAQEEIDAKNREIEEQKRVAQAEIDKKNEEMKAREREIEKQEDEIRHKKELAEAEERAKIETAERIKRETEAKEAEEKRLAEKAERERIAEQERVEADKKYQEFLASHGYTLETKDEYFVTANEDGYTLYKKVGFLVK